MRIRCMAAAVVAMVFAQASLQPRPAEAAEGDGKLRIICFGAHPDDAEFKASGVAAKWSALGHHVKFVSVTNGDIGHWKMAGGPLAIIDCFGILSDAQIRRYFELGCEVKALGRGHVQRIKDAVRNERLSNA